MNITVLCKIVDNFGDIGVVWRLCKRLSILSKDCEINLIVDDLKSFSCIWNSVKMDVAVQNVDGINVYDWTKYDFCYNEFKKDDGNKLSVILECFQCGRPDWMEKILFDDKLERTVHIIMIDYLTAEKYAEDFHCLKSLTRSAKVQKVNFMPGFTNKTGGLIIDDTWENLSVRNPDGPILIFTYERNWMPLIKSIGRQNNSKKILVAKGRGEESIMTALSEYNNKVQPNQGLQFDRLDFLNQNEWDMLMKSCSSLVIRGEESMSRACLSGIPFIWHAYPQSDEYQLVKVNALLAKMKGFFYESDFEIVKKVWLCFNSPSDNVSDVDFELACDDFFKNIDNLEYGFRSFAIDLRKNGDLVYNLMTFINQIDIM